VCGQVYIRERHCFGAIGPLAKTLGFRFRRVNATRSQGIATHSEENGKISLLWFNNPG
jgi:hypothetical protein